MADEEFWGSASIGAIGVMFPSGAGRGLMSPGIFLQHGASAGRVDMVFLTGHGFGYDGLVHNGHGIWMHALPVVVLGHPRAMMGVPGHR
jgi:hypothetical protein